ncbi:hypothetical protein HK405_013434, partial [Cladochytrium tenue]
MPPYSAPFPLHVQRLPTNDCCVHDSDYTTYRLSRWQSLDGREIERSERILAAQVFEAIRTRLVHAREERLASGAATSEEHQNATAPQVPVKENSLPLSMGHEGEKSLDDIRHEFLTKPVAHTPEARREAAADVEALNRGRRRDGAPAEAAPARKNKSPPPPTFAPDGRVLQRNQGRWTYRLVDVPAPPGAAAGAAGALALEVELGRFLDSSLVDVDVHPTWVRVVAKGQVLVLALDCEVVAHDAVCERSRASGRLVVTMRKVAVEGAPGKGAGAVVDLADIVAHRKREASEFGTAAAARRAAAAAGPDKSQAPSRNRRLGWLAATTAKDGKCAVVDARVLPADVEREVLVDDSDVPPL